MTSDESDVEGVVRMEDEDIERFLSSQHVGVLGLPTDGAPSMRPLSFWFDGESSLYFLFILGAQSRKEAVTAQAEVARFLVYRAETAFIWRSVLLTGPISAVPEEEVADIAERIELGRRPDVFERASQSARTRVYRLDIEEWSGVKSVGLPPGFTEDGA